MSQLSLSIDSSLLVRDARGRYLLATAEQILDAARQVIDQRMHRGTAMTSPRAVCDFLRAKLSGFTHEVFAVLFLDHQHRLIAYAEMFRGTIDQASVYPREVVKEALAHNAAAVIFSHNHPSGSPIPSGADEAITRRLREALALVNIKVLDHIVVAGNDTTSMAESGLL
jgi:DNA repair protein RadC